MMKKCNDCKFCIQIDYGYSNYTIEGTTIDCLLNLNPNLPEDRFYGEEPALLYANECNYFSKGDSVNVDVDMVDGELEDYSDDPFIKPLLKRYQR